MAKAKKTSTPRGWSKSDLRTLKSMAKTDTARAAAKMLGRTPGAVQQKASATGISFAKKAIRKKK
jgi:hypothetical protein